MEINFTFIAIINFTYIGFSVFRTGDLDIINRELVPAYSHFDRNTIHSVLTYTHIATLAINEHVCVVNARFLVIVRY